MIRVGTLAEVEENDVVGVVFPYHEKSPVILMRGGHEVKATKYVAADRGDRESVLVSLLDAIAIAKYESVSS